MHSLQYHLHRYYKQVMYGLLALVSSCTPATDLYDAFPARLRVEPLSQSLPLYKAVHNPGLFCMVYRTDTHTRYIGQWGEHIAIPLTALAQQGGYYQSTLGNGFIIGRTNIPEIGQLQTALVAYDRSCPNDYTLDYITRPLDFSPTSGLVICTRCHRTYDLNQGGEVKDGPAGRKLFRYRVHANGNTLLLAN